MDDTDLIIAAGVVVTGTTLLRNATQGKRKAAPIVFGFLMVFFLLLVDMAAPKFARGLAYLAMVGAFVLNGSAVFKLASGLTSHPIPPTPARNTPPGSLRGPIVPTSSGGSSGGGILL